MQGHYTYLGQLLPKFAWDDNGNVDKFVTAGLLGLALIILGRLLSKRLSDRKSLQENIVPPKKATLVGVVDFILEIFVKYQDSVMGPENRKYLSFTGSVFFFLLLGNLLGMIPGVAAITTTVWVNVGVAIVVFLYFNYLGIKEHGLLGYLKHFCGPIWAIAILLFPVEMISTFLRILTLNLRLYWNITSDHLVLGLFTDMFPFVGIPFYFLGAFVSIIQALVFTTLTMIYIVLATEHEQEH